VRSDRLRRRDQANPSPEDDSLKMGAHFVILYACTRKVANCFAIVCMHQNLRETTTTLHNSWEQNDRLVTEEKTRTVGILLRTVVDHLPGIVLRAMANHLLQTWTDVHGRWTTSRPTQKFD